MQRLFKKSQNFSLHTQILLFVIGLLLISCVLIGIPSYIIARNELDLKGKTTLKNAVIMAMMLIDSKNEEVLSGSKSLEEAQEEVKYSLIGPMNSDGTRTMLHTVDLGKSGYFIVYDLEGTEVLHPTLEGTNVWNVTAPNDPSRFIVQEQIDLATQGGGFLSYPWHYPHDTGFGDKLSYSSLEPHWNWIVVATAYTKDFNEAADNILTVTFISSIILIIIGVAVSIEYIHSITQPLQAMTLAMHESEEGIFKPLPQTKRKDELGVLLNGYNTMVSSRHMIYQALKDRESKISHYAYFDTLTGLPNTNKMKEIVDNAIQSSVPHGFLVLFDIKDFKTINSIYGTHYGDQVIQVIGQLMVNFSDATIHLGRHTGTEFIGWFELHSIEALKTKRAEFVRRLKQAFIEQKMDINLDFITCYTTYPKDGTTYDSLLQKNIIAIQHCKMKSITDLTSYDPLMYQTIEQETIINNHAITGLLEGEFKLFYQSKVHTITHEIIGFEALARWFSRDLGSISPAVFIPIFSRSHLITDFSEFVVRQALNDLPRLQEKYGAAINVSINISPLFLAKAHFVDFLINEVRLRELSPIDIILEITEDILITDTMHIRNKINQLRRIGFKISLDDFGTGYSSLNYLRNMPLDEIKIDKSFIDHLIDDPKARALLKSIITIAAAFNCNVVAEGVETEAQAKLVTDAGCDLIQGYLYSKPSPL